MCYEAQSSKEQKGFRKKCTTTGGIYSVERIHQMSNCKRKHSYLLLFEFTAVYDHIPRKWLFD